MADVAKAVAGFRGVLDPVKQRIQKAAKKLSIEKRTEPEVKGTLVAKPDFELKAEALQRPQYSWDLHDLFVSSEEMLSETGNKQLKDVILRKLATAGRLVGESRKQVENHSLVGKWASEIAYGLINFARRLELDNTADIDCSANEYQKAYAQARDSVANLVYPINQDSKWWNAAE